MDLQYERGHAAWKRTRSDVELDMQHGPGHGQVCTWFNVQVQVYAATLCPCYMSMSTHVHIHAVSSCSCCMPSACCVSFCLTILANFWGNKSFMPFCFGEISAK